MTPKRRPTLRAVRLGQELKKVRDEAGYSLRQLATDLGVNSGRLSKKESGWLPALTSDIDAYLEACHVHDPHRRDELYKIREDVMQKGWWDGYAGDIAGTLMDRIWLESKATHIDTFAAILLPGLLQTPRYAEAVMRLITPDVDALELKRWIEVRATRQHILTRHDPVEYRAVIDEAVLRREVGGADVMRPQLDYLVKATEQDNIEIRVLPFSSGMHASLTGAFEILTLLEPYPSAGLLQVPGGDVCVEGDTIDLLMQTYDRLLEMSLAPETSRELIAAERKKL